jgi:hypothetical protein
MYHFAQKVLLVGRVLFQIGVGQELARVPMEPILGEHAEHIESADRNLTF